MGPAAGAKVGTAIGGPVGGVLGAIGGAIISGVGSIFSNRGAKRREREARKWNLEQWHRQNQYNLPSNQMQRLQAAGLNPNLIYGSGSANTGIAGSVAPGKAAPYNVKDPTPSMIQGALIESQISNINSVTSKNNADTAKTLGLTPALIAEQKAKATKAAEEAIQAKVKTGYITEQQKAQTESLMSKAELDVVNLGYQKAYVKFKKGLIKQGIDPQGGLNTTLLKWFVNAFEYSKQIMSWLDNPGDKVNR